MCPSKDTTLEPWSQEGGPLDEAARSRWLAALYAQLRARAQAELVGERAGHTLSAKALVNEVYIKLSGQRDLGRKADSPQASPLDRGVFFGLAAQSMRRILVDHARAHGRTKRGGGAKREGGDALQGLAGAYPSSPLSSNVNAALDPIDLDAAPTKLSIEHEQAALCNRGTVVEGQWARR